MADDFFADLLPMRPRVSVSNGEVGRVPSTSSYDARQEPPAVASARTAELPDLLSPDPKEEQSSGVDLQALSAKQLEGFEYAVENTMRRFASGLKIVLEDIHKRVGAIETKLGDIDTKVQDSRELEKEQGLGLKDRLEVWDKSLKDMHRGIQLIRDKQELLDAQAELAQLKKLEEVKKQEEAKKAQEAKAAVDNTRKPSQAPTAPTPTADAPPPTPVSIPPATPAPSVASQLSVDPPRPVPQDPTPTPSAPSAPLAPQPPTPFQQHSQAAPQSMPPTHSAQYTGGSGQQQYSPSPQMSQGYPPQAPQQSQQQNAQAPVHYASGPQHNAQPQQYPQPSQPPPASMYQHPSHAQQPQPSQSSQYQGTPGPQRYNSTPQPQPQPQPQTYSNYSSNTSGSQYSTAPYASNYGPANKSSGYPTLPHSQPSFPQQHQQGSSYSSGPASGPSSVHYSAAQPSYRLPQASHAPSNSYQRPSNRPPAPPSGEAAPRDFPLEQVIDDVCNMGFSRHEVRAAVAELTDKGQAVDLNVLLDRLMNGPRR